jgi:hypothetical protein
MLISCASHNSIPKKSLDQAVPTTEELNKLTAELKSKEEKRRVYKDLET